MKSIDAPAIKHGRFIYIAPTWMPEDINVGDKVFFDEQHWIVIIEAITKLTHDEGEVLCLKFRHA